MGVVLDNLVLVQPACISVMESLWQIPMIQCLPQLVSPILQMLKEDFY